jgi:hypothetical protein
MTKEHDINIRVLVILLSILAVGVLLTLLFTVKFATRSEKVPVVECPSCTCSCECPQDAGVTDEVEVGAIRSRTAVYLDPATGVFELRQNPERLAVNVAKAETRHFNDAILDGVMFSWGTCRAGSRGPYCEILPKDLSPLGRSVYRFLKIQVEKP